MTSTGFEPSWQWPQDLPGGWAEDVHATEDIPASETKKESEQKSRRAYSTDHDFDHSTTYATGNDGTQDSTDSNTRSNTQSNTQSNAAQSDTYPNTHSRPDAESRRFYRPRTCRICLETVLPTFHPPSETIPGVFQSFPSVTYESPEEGRLIRPCLCKGSQKYVHEGCLTAWRLQDPLEKRNYWQCPTCRYKYRLERMAWGRWISSTFSQVALTLAIFLVATFILGYVADPILNFYIDPYGTIADIPAHGTQAMYYEDEPDGWLEHFLKGMASLGILGFAKFLLTLSPFQWFNMRGTGVMGGGARAGANGRERLQQISWIAVMVGIVTVLVALWKGVRAWSRNTLENFSERVIDVPGDDKDDEDE